MKRIKLLSVTALLLVTISVFAGRAKFTPFELYVETAPSTYVLIGSSFSTLNNLTTSSIGATAVTIDGRFGSNLPVKVSDNGGSKVQVYTSNF